MFQHHFTVRLWSVLLLFLFPLLMFAAEITIRGNVVDKDTKEPLIGCSVGIKGTAWGSMTDFYGNFTITANVTDPKNIVLVFSYVGYNTLEIVVVNTKEAVVAELLREAIMIGDELVVSASRVGERITESPFLFRRSVQHRSRMPLRATSIRALGT